MKKSLDKALKGYQAFREKYALGDQAIMQTLSHQGQNPEILVVACCDSRVDPALILQCDPGDLFVIRNVANIVPPFEKDDAHHGTSAALEFGICGLKVKHLILLGHSQCGGIQALVNNDKEYDFINDWMALVKTPDKPISDPDELAKLSLQQSYQNCLSFPWIKAAVENKTLQIHQWWFDIKNGRVHTFCEDTQTFKPLDENS